nr:MAG TPA: hypothetical protein [Caudoviricetes sp.]
MLENPVFMRVFRFWSICRYYRILRNINAYQRSQSLQKVGRL